MWKYPLCTCPQAEKTAPWEITMLFDKKGNFFILGTQWKFVQVSLSPTKNEFSFLLSPQLYIFYPSRCNWNFEIGHNQSQCKLWGRTKARKWQYDSAGPGHHDPRHARYPAHSSHWPFSYMASLAGCKKQSQTSWTRRHCVGKVDWGL